MSEGTPIKSYQHDSQNIRQPKDKRLGNVNIGKTGNPQHFKKYTENQEIQRHKEVVFPMNTIPTDFEILTIYTENI